MNTYKSLPDLGKAMIMMSIHDHLSTICSPNHTNLLASTIEIAIHEKKPIATICKFILESAAADKRLVVDVVGEDCLTRIKSLYGKN